MIAGSVSQTLRARVDTPFGKVEAERRVAHVVHGVELSDTGLSWPGAGAAHSMNDGSCGTESKVQAERAVASHGPSDTGVALDMARPCLSARSRAGISTVSKSAKEVSRIFAPSQSVATNLAHPCAVEVSAYRVACGQDT